MDTDFIDYQTQSETVQTAKVDKEFVIPYNIRIQFRLKLLEFMSSFKENAYVWAEDAAKRWFENEFGIPYDSWNFRETKSAIKARNKILGRK